MTNQINPQKLIPEHWRIHVPSELALVFFGSNNLEFIKQYWERKAKELENHIETIDHGPTSRDTKLTELIAKKSEIEEYINSVSEMIKQTEPKPYFADHRPLNWFTVGDEVVCFIYNDVEGALKKGVFVTGKVVDGYRDGYVAVHTNEPVHTGDYGDGHGLDYGTNRPEVMKKWEYDYFVAHPNYLRVWLGAVDMPKYDASEMREAFTRLK